MWNTRQKVAERRDEPDSQVVKQRFFFFFFFRMPWLSFASHLNPSPYFVFFSLFVPYRITNPNKFLFIGEPSDFDSI